jgi:hypothetical protein
LGAICRLATTFDIYTRPGLGTALLARVFPGREKTLVETGLVVDGVSIAKPGETACGDAWWHQAGRGRHTVLVVDGLGHGPLAETAALDAVNAFRRHEGMRPAALLEILHDALRGTRGAAASVAEVDLDRGLVTFAGIGNVAGAVCSAAGNRRMVSNNGTLGHETPKFREFTYPWNPDDVLLMHTDGVSAHWDLEAYPGLYSQRPALIAATVFRDFSRGRDDSTVVAARMVAA